MFDRVLTYTCAVLRDAETGTNPLGEPQTQRTTVVSEAACRPVDRRRSAYSDAEARFVTHTVKTLLIGASVGIQEGDIVTNVTGPTGDVDARAYTVKDVIVRIGRGGYAHHKSVELEVIGRL